jgi:CRISPR type I-E-associated protein CasB/Cse2
MPEPQPPESTEPNAPPAPAGTESGAQGREAPSVHRVVHGLARRLQDASTGDLAELRRVGPDQPHTPAFWKLITGPLDPLLPSAGPRRVEAEERWAVILSAMAELAGFHNPQRSLGRALAEADVHELRVTRLLRARGQTLDHSVRAVVHQLASKAMSFRMADLAWLVLSEGKRNEQEIRHQIARDYYRARHERSTA